MDRRHGHEEPLRAGCMGGRVVTKIVGWAKAHAPCPPLLVRRKIGGHATLCPPFCNGRLSVNPLLRCPLAGSRFCTGSAQGRHLMGLEEDRSTNLRSRAQEATWWATALPAPSSHAGTSRR